MVATVPSTQSIQGVADGNNLTLFSEQTPTAPSNLSVAYLSDTSLRLTWLDNSDNETGFEIERSLDGTTGWILITTAAANTTTYDNTGLSANVQYYYRIRATNNVGDSAWTSVVRGTTVATPSLGADVAETVASSDTTIGTYAVTNGAQNIEYFLADVGVTSNPVVNFDYGTTITAANHTETDWLVVQSYNTDASVYSTLSGQGTKPIVYVSVGEVARNASYWGDIDPSWIIGYNANWDADIIDMRNAACRNYVLTNLMNAEITLGAEGVFLDTLDSYMIALSDSNDRANYEAGMDILISDFKAANPSASVIANRGFTIFPAISDNVDALVFESYYQGYNGIEYTTITQGDRDWLDGQIALVLGIKPIPIICIDYTANANEQALLAGRLALAGFIPVVGLGDLDGDSQTLSVGEGVTFAQPGTYADGFSISSSGVLTDDVQPVEAGSLEVVAANDSGYDTQRITISISGAPSLPDAPSSLSVAYLSDTSLRLNWLDNASNETGFEVQRSLDGATGWTLIASPAANVLTYDDTGLPTDATRYYRVRATNATGNSAWTSVASGTTTAQAFQLSASNYVSQRMALDIVNPRPDGERTSDSRYSFAYPGIEFEVPIAVQGGAYPFLYEITARSGTADVANATIGETRTYNVGREWYGSQNHKDYGVLRWTPAASDNGKSYSFTVRVTGQDGVQESRTFTGLVDESKFIFIEDGYSGPQAGTLTQPFEDNSDWWGIDGNDATHAGKFVYFKSGNYEAFPSSVINANKPRVYMAFPGLATRPVFAGTTKDYSFDSVVNDFWWSGIYVDGTPGTNVGQCRFFDFGTNVSEASRFMFWDNYFYNGRVGSTANDNNGWIIILRNGDKLYGSILSNIFDTANQSSNGFNACTMFSVGRFVVEHNVLKNFVSETGFQVGKDDTNNWSVRANDMWEGNACGPLYLRCQDVGGRSFNQEVCWNFINDSEGYAVGWNAQKAVPLPGPLYVYRNTMLTPDRKAPIYLAVDSDSSPLEEVEAIKNVNVAQNNSYLAPQLDPFASTDAEMEAWMANGTFDSTYYDSDSQTEVNTTTGLLQNGGTTVRGEYGAEVRDD